MFHIPTGASRFYLGFADAWAFVGDPGWYDDNTFIIRTDNIDRLKTFLETFGLDFKQEQHGKGPIHFSCVSDDKVLEIYPVKR